MALGAILAGAQLAIGVGKAIAGHKGQQKQYFQNKRSALKNLQLTNRDLTIQTIERTIARRQSEDEAGLALQQSLGTSRAAAAASGVAGASVEAIDQSLVRDFGRFKDTTAFNFELTLDQVQRLREQAGAQAQDQINQVQRPSLLNTALSIGGSVLGAVNQQYSLNKIPGYK